MTDLAAEPKLAAEDLDGFRRKLRQVLKWELPRWRPIARELAWKRRWRPENQEEAEHEVGRWLVAPGHPEDLLERLLGPLAWLGARILSRAAPRDRRLRAKEFVDFATRPDATGSSFLERELASLDPQDLPRKLHGSLKKLGPLYRLLFRGGQEWFEQRLAEGLETEIRRIYLPSALSKTRAGRLIRDALLSERPGEALRKLLNRVGWSQASWARAVGLRPATISHWIAGRNLRADNLRRLVEKLDKELAPKSDGSSSDHPLQPRKR